ncbi:MAG: hypothetical protein HY549_11115 [Elusimicrobia bacterium]|nr:hypothetical protein [Elusimicrobiota bacterium]
MLRSYVNFFARRCQFALIGAFLVLGRPGARAAEPAPILRSESPVAAETNAFLRRLARMHFGGSLSLSWRNVGPRKPGFETQIQNQVYLADMYFGFDGPLFDGIPVQMEWHVPTAGQGTPRLNQLNFGYRRVNDLLLQFGMILVPFGRYNELYRPDQFLTVTRPLLYASPDSLDLVVRINSPRPPLSSGYTDIGARASYYPPTMNPAVPQELTFFVVNGLSESNNRLRTFPNTDNLGIPGVPPGGATVDFGHQNNNLADNNNSKSIGARAVFSLGDLRFPWPIPEGASDLKGVNVGLSAMGGQYDLDGKLNYQMYGLDFNFDYLGFNISGEYLYSSNHFLAPVFAQPALLNSSGTLVSPTRFTRGWEINQGYFIQGSLPILRTPRLGQRLTGVLVFNQMFRRGPILDLFLNTTVDGTLFPSIGAIGPDPLRVTRRIDKYTAALHYQLTDHFFFKLDYSYWVMSRATTRTVNSIGLVDIYQTAVSMVMGF